MVFEVYRNWFIVTFFDAFLIGIPLVPTSDSQYKLLVLAMSKVKYLPKDYGVLKLLLYIVRVGISFLGE